MESSNCCSYSLWASSRFPSTLRSTCFHGSNPFEVVSFCQLDIKLRSILVVSSPVIGCCTKVIESLMNYRSHLSTTWLWYVVITLHELNDHSGFHFPWLRSPQAHDFHHKVGTANFGNWCRLLDVLYGTDVR